jgi:glucan 1,3-beta-glucosidase
MAPTTSLLTSTLVGLSFALSVFSFTPGFPYGSEKVRGVNLGGWLVLEVSTLLRTWVQNIHFDDALST